MPRRMILMPVLIPFIGATAGCLDSTPAAPVEEWAAVCVDPRDPGNPADDVRLDDDACGDYDDDGDGTHSTFFFLWSGTGAAQPVPAVGGPTKGYVGHRHYPLGSTTINKLPATGSVSVKEAVTAAVKANPDVQRGGLGVPKAGAGQQGGSKSGGSAGG